MKYNMHGWKKQELDPRDYAINSSEVRKFFAPITGKLPVLVDLRGPNMPPIVDQGSLGSCTANAAAAIIDFCLHKAHGKFLTPSRLYQYYNTRLIENSVDEDSGASIRDSVKAIAQYGAIPEFYRPYKVERFTEKPTAMEYTLGEKYQAIKYVLIDQPRMTGIQIATELKRQLSIGFPITFGTPVYEQIERVSKSNPIIMAPQPGERSIGGHAMVLVGYDDTYRVGGGVTGAFLLRNSWGTSWGRDGYGYLPYSYVTKKLACDFWVLVSEEWVEPTMVLPEVN